MNATGQHGTDPTRFSPITFYYNQRHNQKQPPRGGFFIGKTNMPLKISQYGPLIVGPMNSVFPADHVEFRDGKWRELVSNPACIATFAQDDIGAECARIVAMAPDLIMAGKHLAVKLAEVYAIAGRKASECQAIRDWMAAVAKAEGRS